MKELMQKVFAFLAFDQLVTRDQIDVRLQHLRNSHKQGSNERELTSVCRELIYEYWYNYVAKHFSALFLTVVVISNFAVNRVSLPAVVIAGIISFLGFYWFFYRFVFNFIFLPELDSIKASLERNRLEETRKCKKAQYSNFALVIIDSAKTDISGMASFSCDDKSALILTELYGVDTGSMKKNLELLFLKNKRKHFTERNKTEYKNCFDEAYNYFEKCKCLKGIERVKKFETDFFN